MQMDATAVADRWASQLGGATEKIKAGVLGVTVSPGALAARQADVWAANTAAAKDKFRRKSAGTSLAEWQRLTIDKGLQRIGSGAQDAKVNFAQFMTNFLPFVAASVAALPPRGNLDANINRMTQHVRKMATYQGPPAGR